MKAARRASEISGQNRACLWRVPYATRKTWPWKRRSSIKPSVRATNKEPKDNPRSGHHLKQSPQWIYEKLNCQRGDVRKTGSRNCRRHADRPDQLLEFLGEHLPGAADRGGVCG